MLINITSGVGNCKRVFFSYRRSKVEINKYNFILSLSA